MSGKPWEKYQQQAQASGPWQKFQQSTPQSAIFNVKDEQSPEVGFMDRFVAKNFASSPMKQVEYLKQQHPDLDVQLINDQVAIKKPGDSEYKVLDPSGFDLQDVTDLAYDIPAGVAQGAATAIGAAAGALSPVPGGVVMGSMGGSGASGAALEAARQGIGKLAGIPQDIDGDQVAMSGAISTVTPGLFGVGKPAAAMVAKYAAQNGITEEVASKLLDKMSRGVVERGYDSFKQKLAPKLGELVSGIDNKVISAYANNMDQVDQLEKNGVMDYAQRLTDKVNETLGAAEQKAGKNVQAAMENAGQKVDVSGAKKAFQDRINFLQNKPDITNAEKAELSSLQNAYEKYFGLAKQEKSFDNVALKETVQTEIPNDLDATRAFDLQKKLKQAAAFETNMTPETLSAKGSARQAYGSLNQSMDESTGGLSQQAKDEYAKLMGIQNELGNSFDTAQKTYNTITGLDAKGRQMLAERLKQMSDNGMLDINNETEVLQAYNAFANPSVVPVGFKGTTSTSRSVPLSLLVGGTGAVVGHKMAGYPGMVALGAAGTKLGNVAGSPAAIKKYIKGTKALENAASYLQPPMGASLVTAPAVNQTVSPWLWYQMQEQQQP